ncbi:MAG: hypothetical protein JWM99_741 [Verrucomicrobiales bacterium]|nr:hypothetical protein [Verrucomicrobiales bacterium]
MKQYLIAIAFLSGALLVRGQGTPVWDQGDTGFVDGFALLNNQPLGQSFTPSFSSIGVVELWLGDNSAGSGDIAVNVRSGSITGTILGTTASLSYSTTGMYDFLFSDPIALTPGTKYFLQPFALSGSGVGANLVNSPSFTGGAIYGGTVHMGFNFWFQEGIVGNVPEPSSAALCIVVVSVLIWHHKKRP